MADQQRDESDAGLLRIESLTLAIGGLLVLDQISMSVPPGIVCGLVGPNGAGKTSLFNCVSGLYRPTSGRILIGGTDANRVPPHRLGRRSAWPATSSTRGWTRLRRCWTTSSSAGTRACVADRSRWHCGCRCAQRRGSVAAARPGAAGVSRPRVRR